MFVKAENKNHCNVIWCLIDTEVSLKSICLETSVNQCLLSKIDSFYGLK